MTVAVKQGGAPQDTPEFRNFKHLLIDRGVAAQAVAETMGVRYPVIWRMLRRVYGYPASPEKRAALVAALNEFPGEPVTEAHIWSVPDQLCGDREKAAPAGAVVVIGDGNGGGD